ncbi:hypothetical protein FEDK69T_01150 [Flavobacterium enshiense DK69]|nr:hypothetical protein FEDK69T_01150 [Flavobacterium enshiense DK69]
MLLSIRDIHCFIEEKKCFFMKNVTIEREIINRYFYPF